MPGCLNMSRDFEQIIDKLTQEWTAKGIEVKDRLRAPTDAPSLERVAALVGAELPDDLISLYAKFDGDVRQNSGVFAGLHFLSVQEVLDALHFFSDIMDGMDEEPAPDDPSLPHPSLSHIPIFTDGTGNYLGVDVKPTACGHFGQAIVFGSDFDEVRVPFASLTDLLAWCLNLHQSGRMTYSHSNGVLTPYPLLDRPEYKDDLLAYLYNRPITNN